MPRNQNFVIENVQADKITGFTSSKNLKMNQENFEYTELNYDKDLIT